MKLSVLAASSVLGTAAAFAPASTSSRATMALNGEKSPAMPFLPYPEGCRGYIGDDIAFDPLNLSSYFSMDYLREAEIKNGRIAMLAIVGFITVDLGIVVHPLGKGLSSVAAHNAMVENGVMGNILIWVCVAECFSYLAVSEMMQGSGREPGYYGFGTKYYENKSPEEVKKLKYNEIMNGRLAMLAFGGAVSFDC
jgi:light-harvesting complex I chlorophyll a/b binding protein 1